MTENINSAIRFLRYWRGREAGQVVDSFDYGVRQMLVLRGIAEWCAVPVQVPEETADVPAVLRKRKG